MTRDRMGATTSYSRDGLKRVYKVETKASAASPVVATFTAVNGLTTTRTRSFGGSAALFLGSTTLSMDGLTTTETGPSLKSTLVADRPVTTTVITRGSSSGDTETITHADLSTSITSSYLDGRIKSIGGTAVPDKSYDYAAHNENGGGEKTIVTASGVVTTTFTDLLDRTRKIVSGATGTTTYAYHPVTATAGWRGKLQSVTDADNVAVSYGYNGEGERTTTSRVIPLASGTATQVTTTARDVVSGATLHGVSLGTSIRRTETVASTGVSAITTARSYADIGGLVSGSDSFGRQTLDIRTRPDSSSGIATRTTTNSDGTKTVETTTHGLVSSVQAQTTAGVLVSGTSFAYDPFQRLRTQTDSRTGATTYDPDAEGIANVTESGQALSIKDPGSRTTNFDYDIMGRLIKTTLPDTTVTNTAYYPTGQVKVTWGSQTYPTWNVYDEQGRQTQLHTWKTAPVLNPASIPTTPPTGSEITSWIYGASTGRLDRKQYPDTKGIDYTYTSAGRLKTRTWARGVVTTYGYDAGMPKSVTYTNDPSNTPNIVYTYEAMGRLRTVTQGSGGAANTHTYAYKDDNNGSGGTLGNGIGLHSETIAYGGAGVSRVIVRNEDSLLRSEGWQILNGGTIEHGNSYTYDDAGRLKTVTGTATGTHTYGYVPVSANLIERVDNPPDPGHASGSIGTVLNNWEPTRDVLDVHNNLWVSAFDYTVNGIGQRTKVVAWGTMHDGYDYDYYSSGEIKSAQHASQPTWHRAYGYDAIGNITNAAGGNLTVPSTPNWFANSSNQYTAIGTFNGFAYDDDGNTTTGVFAGGPTGLQAGTLTWDAENRLIASNVPGALAATYAYDYLGRRIRKTSGSATLSYIYDGWNLAAEYDGTTLLRGHTWGLDLSGTLQGAGGVGGLLATRVASGPGVGNFYPMCDGNGNVTDYLDGNGSVVAHHEYDPFGNIIQVSGTHVGYLPFRFSTKYHDNYETQMLYYGYRYYQPFVGRWISRDPIEERGGENLYGFVFNDPVSTVDLLGLDVVIQIGLGTGNGISGGNPFGHAAFAIQGKGTYSPGTNTDPGSRFSDYLESQNKYRDSQLYVVPTTPEQDEAIAEAAKKNGTKLDGTNTDDNCSTRVTKALKAGGVPVDGKNSFPADLQRDLDKMVNEGKATRFASKQGSQVHPVWQMFNPK